MNIGPNDSLPTTTLKALSWGVQNDNKVMSVHDNKYYHRKYYSIS